MTEIENDIKDLIEKYGEIAIFNCIESIKSKIKMDSLSDNWDSLCPNYGLSPSDKGKVFYMSGTPYELTGIKPANRKYPIIAKRVTDGRIFKFPVITISYALKNNL